MTAYTYTSMAQAVAAALNQGPLPYVFSLLPPNFQQLFQQGTSYAEGRIARDLVLVNTRSQPTGSTTGGAQQFSLSGLTAPSGLALPLVVLEGVDLTVAGVNYAFEKTSLDTVNMVWPNASMTLSPAAADWVGRWWAMLNDATIVLAPTPDNAYTLTATGLFVQAPMTGSNPTTYIGTVYGDLMFVAVMIYMSGALMGDYGAMADDPRSAQSWEAQYAALLPGCEIEEARRRGLTVDDLRAKREMQAAAAPARA